MGLLKKFKLASKLAAGFGTVLLILVCIVISEYIGLVKISQNFTQFSDTSYADTLAGKVQSNLLESRIAFKNFMQTGDITQKNILKNRFVIMEDFIEELKNKTNNPDIHEKTKYILEYSKEYKDCFEKVFTLKDRRNDLYTKFLNVKGPALEENLSSLLNISYDRNQEELYYSVSMTLRSLLISRLHIARYLENHDIQEYEIAKMEFAELDKWLTNCLQATDDSDLKQMIYTMIEDYKVYTQSFEDINSVIIETDNRIEQMDLIGPKISLQAEKIQLSIIDDQSNLDQVVRKRIKENFARMLSLTLFALLSSILITILIVKLIVTPVKTVTNTFKEISEGDADLEVRLKVNSTDEIGDMAKFFNKFMVKLQVIMTNDKNQTWLKAGQAELNEKIRGEQTVETLSNNIITFVSKYINAQIGAFYIKSEDNLFKLIGSYAYHCNMNPAGYVQIGEGLIGQAALEEQSILVSNVPEDYIKVTSGTGEAVPKNLLITPCLVNHQVQCILEFASFHEFSDIQLEFIEQISEMIAISIQSTQAQIKMKELLDKTLEQAEELQVQQEELRQSNEELEDQAKALRESEARLQVQQEELRQSNEELEEQTRALKESEVRMQQQQEELQVINEELEERTKSLELQKNDISTKNEILRNTRNEIEEKAEALETASRYKSEFLANMSHELRTPLNSILVLSQMLAEKKDNTPLTEKQLQFARTIHSSGTDLLKLINDILDLSKVEAGKMEFVFEEWEIAELIQYMERSFRPIAAQKGLDFDIHIEEGSPDRIITDSQRVQQIINNLISNAFKFTSNGKVAFTVGKSMEEDATHFNGDTKEMLRIVISDTGIGIPKDKQEIIFEAFKQSDGTTSRKYGGTGLGLSISKELAANLGGEIKLQSELGEGSSFTLYLPLNQVNKKDSEQAADNNGNDSGRKSWELAKDTDTKMDEPLEDTVTKNIEPLNNPVAKTVVPVKDIDTKSVETKKNIVLNQKLTKIKDDRQGIRSQDKSLLIIEDDENFSLILQDLAHEKGYKCIIAEEGQLGIELAKKYKPDAVLLDIGLPDINGWKAIECLKADISTEKIPIHVITGRELENRSQALDGIIGYLQKPVNLESLDAAFEKIRTVNHKPFKKLLIVDENKQQAENITKLIENKEIQVISIDNGTDALNLLKMEQIDCIILDLKMKDMSGYELLKKIKTEYIDDLPVIIHTEKTLEQEDELELRKYAESIIVKGSKSVERLIAETSLFLHDLESKFENEKIKAIKSEQEKENSFQNKKILVVDDDMRNVFALSSLLEEKGMSVVVGRNGKEGIEKLKQNPDINLILMDIMMPEMDGYTAMMEIRKQEKYRKIPIIALTAKAMKEDKQKCIEAGANDYLTKPLDTNKLMSLLRVWLYK